MKNITFTADEKIIEKARARAKNEKTTLNKRFREWLENYSGNKKPTPHELDEVFDRLKTKTGGPFTRDEMNER